MNSKILIFISAVFLLLASSKPQSSRVTFTLARGQTKCFKDDFVKGQVTQYIINNSLLDLRFVL